MYVAGIVTENTSGSHTSRQIAVPSLSSQCMKLPYHTVLHCHTHSQRLIMIAVLPPKFPTDAHQRTGLFAKARADASVFLWQIVGCNPLSAMHPTMPNHKSMNTCPPMARVAHQIWRQKHTSTYTQKIQLSFLDYEILNLRTLRYNAGVDLAVIRQKNLQKRLVRTRSADHQEFYFSDSATMPREIQRIHRSKARLQSTKQCRITKANIRWQRLLRGSNEVLFTSNVVQLFVELRQLSSFYQHNRTRAKAYVRALHIVRIHWHAPN